VTPKQCDKQEIEKKKRNLKKQAFSMSIELTCQINTGSSTSFWDWCINFV